jgi:hypothetical protein
MKKLSILDISEDLLEDDSIQDISKVRGGKRKITISKVDPRSGPKPITTLIMEATQVLGLDPQKLSAWSKDHSLPTEVLKNILLTAKRLKQRSAFRPHCLGV